MFCPNPECSAPVRPHVRHCHVCDEDIGYPNVRAATEEQEASQLEARFIASKTMAANRGCLENFERFREAVGQSKAVLCRSIGQVMTLVSSDNELYATFYDLVRASSRLPEDTLIERERLVADDLLFPYYKDAIRFAALTLDGKGITQYGRCSVILADVAIRKRATVFEKNSVDFCRERQLGFGNFQLPSGYRATWEERGKLAAAKLESAISSTMLEDDFPAVLLDNDKRDFVEVHIYGPLHRKAIEAINISGEEHPSDEALVLEIERRAEEVDIKVGRNRKGEK